MSAAEEKRADFEAWWLANMNVQEMDLYRGEPLQEYYICHDTQRGWLVWQACAAQSAERIAELEQQVALLRTGDTCARDCEGTAYRHEAQRLARENKTIDHKLAAAQADNVRLREAITLIRGGAESWGGWSGAIGVCDKALAHPLDTSALDAYVAKANPLRELIAKHGELLDANPYCYFELAYTRRTEWMAWLCSKPQQDDPMRVVIAKGQGATPDEAAADAMASMAAPSPDNQKE